jgi:hypothetical protein
MCGVWCVVCGVWCVVCGVWCVVCGVWCVVCGVWCASVGVCVCVIYAGVVCRLWNVAGLPRDSVSVDSAVIMARAGDVCV